MSKHIDTFLNKIKYSIEEYSREMMFFLYVWQKGKTKNINPDNLMSCQFC